jgi:uncharacterized membrane protein (DUF373 family)
MKNTTKDLLKALGIFILSILLLAVGLGVIGGMLLKSCSEVTSEINDRGLKNIVEEVWEGKQEQGEIE